MTTPTLEQMRERGAKDGTVPFGWFEELVEQFDALKLAATRQLTPLDMAATHIDILRRKSEDYTPQERDNVALIVEQHVNEARHRLFDAISNKPEAS